LKVPHTAVSRMESAPLVTQVCCRFSTRRTRKMLRKTWQTGPCAGAGAVSLLTRPVCRAWRPQRFGAAEASSNTPSGEAVLLVRRRAMGAVRAAHGWCALRAGEGRGDGD